ncbi:Crp/Fnr family transcriptional regulator [Parafrankia sp. FMc2]|uniref:Crp/Fnr family transcriptional regulator n=1 Tax=Parafrankia sp. FMc2 TaxID=3233196 RepID=UPI0034D4F859
MKVERNEVIYTEGESGEDLFFVEAGRVKVARSSICGKGCLLDLYVPGEIFGESCLSSPLRTETATAMMSSSLYRIPRRRFLVTMGEGRIPLEDWLRYLTARLTDQKRLITLMVTKESEQRLAAILWRLARRLGKPDPLNPLSIRIPQMITHQELAEMVGTTRSRIGYFLKHFRDLGLIHTEAPHLVIDSGSLLVYAEEFHLEEC